MARHRPADDAAKRRRGRGIRRVDRVLRDDRFHPHPRRGGSRGYSIPFRRQCVDDLQSGRGVIPSLMRSTRRWANERAIPLRMTGNKPGFSLVGEYLMLLIICKLIWPQATYIECSAFVCNEASTAHIFPEWAVGNALRGLGYTMKVSSTVAHQAFLPRNVIRRNRFWSQPYPVGVRGLRRCRLIDIDEFGLHLNNANKKYGSSPKVLRIRKPGNCDRGTFKLTIILAIEAGDPAIADGLLGSVTKSRVWALIRNIAGTSAVAYTSFVERVLGAYTPVGNAGHKRCIIHDNYSAHKSATVYGAVHRMGHRVLCRPPYRPHDGPVEFAINQVARQLELRWGEVHDLSSMTRVLYDIIDHDLKGMDALFKKCGYRRN